MGTHQRDTKRTFLHGKYLVIFKHVNVKGVKETLKNQKTKRDLKYVTIKMNL